MKREDYIQKRRDLVRQIQLIQQQIHALERKYSESSGFKTGDLVKVTYHGWGGTTAEKICYIFQVYPDPVSHTFKYRFAKQNTDGTMAMQGVGLSDKRIINIEKMEVM